MVETERFLPRVDRMLKLLVALNLFTALVMFVSYIVQLAMLLMVLDAVLVIVAMAVQSWRGHRVAQICLAAFLILATGVVIANLRLAGLLDTTFLTQNGVQIGAAIETIVLAFALADRFHVVRAEKARAQRNALLAERQLVDTLRASERLLEERVQARTAELTQALQDLQRTQADLIEAEKLASLGALVAGVAHELNTPIGNALTTASTMEEAAQSLKQNVQDGSLKRSFLEGFVNSNLEMAQLVVRACQRAATLISSFKRVAVDQTSEQQRRFDLAELVDDNLRALRPSFGAQTWVFDNQVMAVTECDSYPGPLGQVLTNLVQNAVLHGFAGRETGTVRISAQCEDGYVELQVSDDGIGMPDSTLAHIFEPFFTTALGKGGSGLGLAVCRNLVRGVLGGSIRVQSSPGKGTSFFVRFPLTASR
ncbi:MAG: hypothetical protein CFE44_12770 [Burkholderiales bacterium PBB4]|nr:MAG: hypothetical protein CFE44_12770 [Burkholderiales bacterium PBB4]